MSQTESSNPSTSTSTPGESSAAAIQPMLENTALVTESALGAIRGIAAERGMARAVAADLPGAAESSDITDEMDRGGPALGAFVKSVGLAVAEAQTALDKTLVTSAEALSKQKIKVAAVFEQEIDEDGNLQKGHIHEMELPLVNYIMPTAYKWKSVYLEADMDVAEFNAKNGLVIKQDAFSVNAHGRASYGPLGFGASGGFNVGYSNSNTAVATSNSRDSAAGKLHVEATLEPRSDIELPKPFVIQKGPRLTLSASGVEEITESREGPDGSSTTVVIGRKATIECFLQKKDGNPLGAKQLHVEVQPGGLLYESEPEGQKTGSDGKMVLAVTRKGVMYKEGTTMDIVVRVSLNYVTQTLSFKL